jgi:hypothetical protein
MTTTHVSEARQVIHHAAAKLADLEFMDQRTARELSKMAEAVANLFMVVFYQAETGRATHSDFSEAMTHCPLRCFQFDMHVMAESERPGQPAQPFALT